jgi:ABC-type dipeptide/oligopeptide/nickel transport system permease component/ABC-type transport system substrate-binding protein
MAGRYPCQVALILGMLAVACVRVPAGTAATTEPPRAAAPGVTLGMQLEPPMLDPTASPAAAISEALYGNVYEGLVTFAADGSAVPLLADSWEISADGLTYTFHLRRGVRFHDGLPFDAAAARFSLERALGPNSSNPQKSRLEAVRRIETPDDFTLRLLLGRRAGSLLQSLAWGAFVMLSPASAAANAATPVGTGPFVFSGWRRGDSLTLTRNERYWGGRAPLGLVTFKFIADPSAAYAALMAGDVDGFDNYPAPESFGQFAKDERFAVFVGPTEGETLLALNERRPPLNDVRVRRAISHAIDRRAVIDGAMFGYGTPIGSHFPPRNPAYVDLTGEYPHDVAEAKRLLAEAGHAAGFDVTLKLPPPSYARRSGEIIASELAAVGIHARIENLEWAQWLAQVFAGHDFDMSIVVHAEPMDYDIYGRDDYYFGYSSPRYKALLAALEDSIDPAARRDLLGRLQRELADDAVNGFLFQYPKLAVWNVRLQGIGFDNVLGVIDLKNARWVGPAAALDVRASTGTAARNDAVTGGLMAVAAAACLALLWAALRRGGMVFVVRRVSVLALTLLVASGIVFALLQVVPGDPVRTMMGLQAEPSAMAALREQLGLNGPPLKRYGHWLAGLMHGDFGMSYTYRVPVRQLIVERLAVSLPLALYALFLTVIVAVPAGLAAAARRGRAVDWVVNGVSQAGLALPNFWLGLLLVLVFSVTLHWTPAGGFPGWSAGFWPGLNALTLPAVALAAPQAAILASVLRGAMLAALDGDYIRTARAKGVGEWRVLWRHALPNALTTVLTILGLQFSFLLAGGVIIENVFFLSGLGRLVFQAITQRDLIVVQAVVMVLVAAVVVVAFLVDLGYALIDPRLEISGRRDST